MEPIRTTPYLSVVIPAWNEATTLDATSRRVLTYLNGLQGNGELIIADDGSTDATAAAVDRLARTDARVRLLRLAHGGKGHAVKQGMLAARGAFVLFMDADYSTPIEEMDRFWPHLWEGWDVVIGSRKMRGALITRRQPWLRERLGKVFTWLTNTLVTRNLSDITCGFKCFSRAGVQQVFSRQQLSGWGFDAEILFLAQRLGYRVCEVPVRWHNAEKSNVRMGADGWRSLRELLAIRRNARRGVYHLPASGDRRGQAGLPDAARQRETWRQRQRRFYETRAHSHLRYQPGSVYGRRIARQLAHTLNLQPGQRVLEIGCGSGRFSLHLLQEVPVDLTGVDLSPRQLDQFRESMTLHGAPAQARVELRCDDITKLEETLGRAQFDAVIGFFVLHHLQDLPTIFRHIRRVLKPGGRIAFVEPNRWNPLFTVQVAVCPDMPLRDELGMFTLARSRLLRTLQATRFAQPHIDTFGWFPPPILDRVPGALRVELAIERVPLLNSLLPFLLIQGQRPATALPQVAQHA